MIIANMETVSVIALVSEDFTVAPSLETTILDNSTPTLERVPCIHYLLCFKKNQAKIQVLTNSNNEVNKMTLVYMAKLGFKVRLTNIEIQIIDSSTLKIFEMVLANV